MGQSESPGVRLTSARLSSKKMESRGGYQGLPNPSHWVPP